ncbi:MAG: LCP family protein [Candidatus Gastranaerophilaceae bacterium]
MSNINEVEQDEKDLNEEYNQFLKHLNAEKEDTSNFAKSLFGIVIVFCAIILVLLIASENKEKITQAFGEDSFVTKMLLILPINPEHKEHLEFSSPFTQKRQNILLAGVDANGSKVDPWRGARTDTIIILNIDPKTKSINAISVPRDSKVYLPGDFGIQKINSAHAIGGVEMMKNTLERTLGIKINHYILVHDEAVSHIVDALGGVPIYVEKNMYYNDNAGNLHVNLSKGLNILNGRNAVGYLRFRKDGLGDIGRTQRQQWFLKGFMEKLKTPQAIAKIPDMLDAVTSYVKTDMSFYEISQFAALAKGIDVDKIEFATLPGAPNKKGYISYWILDPDKTQDMINRMIYRDNVKDNDRIYNIGIRYSVGNEQLAGSLKEKIQALGYNVNCYGPSALPHSQFIAHETYVSNEFFNSLKKEAPELNKIQFVYNPDKTYCTSSDITILLEGP